MISPLSTGTRIVLIHDVDRYPHFIAPKGALGTVSTADDDIVTVRMDILLPGAEEWDNEIVWSVRDGDDPMRDIALDMPCGVDLGPRGV